MYNSKRDTEYKISLLFLAQALTLNTEFSICSIQYN